MLHEGAPKKTTEIPPSFSILCIPSTNSGTGKGLFQISILDNLGAAADEVAEGLAFEHAVGKKREVGNLLEDFI